MMDAFRFSKTAAVLMALIVYLGLSPTVQAQLADRKDPGAQERGRRISHSDRKAAAERFKTLRKHGAPDTKPENGQTTDFLAMPPTNQQPVAPTPDQIRAAGVPDYYGIYPNYANSPLPVVTQTTDPGTGAVTTSITGGIRKFIDGLPGLGAANKNNVSTVVTDPITGVDTVISNGQYLPIAKPDTTTYDGCDYYEISIREYRERMHSDLPKTGTRLRGFVQTNNGTNAQGVNDVTPDPIHYLGPIIIAQKDRPVRITFTNELPFGTDANGKRLGDLFIPTDTTTMGAGIGPKGGTEEYTQNRIAVHLHGGNTPWISDGTPHQWIVPAGEYPNTSYKHGDSLYHVPDMWFGTDANGNRVRLPGASVTPPTPAGLTDISNDPGPGKFTIFYTNQQSARLLFYHDHALGITRLNVQAGVAAGYVVQDPVELDLVNRGIIPAEQIPLVIQDKSWVPDNTPADPVNPTPDNPPYTNIWGTFPCQLDAQDPLWDSAKWGGPGDFWYPHIYVPLQNKYDSGGINHMGRWHYSAFFWPPFMPQFPPVVNPYIAAQYNADWEPAEIPTFPRPSGVAEAFFDTPVVNGTAYPYLNVEPRAYRFRILNAANDRFWNLQLYVADSTVTTADGRTNTEVKMVPAVVTAGFPDGVTPSLCKTAGTLKWDGLQRWPTDSRDGGVPDPATQGPPFIQIGNEAGFLPTPAVIHPQPVDWNVDVGTFDAGIVDTYALMVAPAERADVIVDFSQFAGKTLILYNDCPAPSPALDPRLDCYTGMPDMSDVGGPPGTQVGWGPNTRTIMQIRVAPGPSDTNGVPLPIPRFNLQALEDAFATQGTEPGAFAQSQKTMLIPQEYYNTAYGQTFPLTLASIFDNSLSFTPINGTTPVTLNFLPKSIQDEMGETFDPEYGRMSAKLGVEQPRTTPNTQTTILYSFFDPPTEVILPSVGGTQIGVFDDGTQIWKITANGVDTHAMHFHMFDVQLINRVSWQNDVREADPNEVGWKDTIKLNPLQDTIVALRPIMPTTPFKVPNSIRLLAPSLPPDVPLMDIWGGAETTNPAGQPVTITNQLINLGWEYVWHCHLLAHEENDMMRAVAAVPVPDPPSGLIGVPDGQPQVALSWTNNTACATSFTVQRAAAADPAFATPTEWQVNWPLLGTPVTTLVDTNVVAGQTYLYRVCANNTVGSTVPGFPIGTTHSPYSEVVSVPVPLSAVLAPTNLTASLREPRLVDLAWSYTHGTAPATAFRIERAVAGGAFVAISTLNNANQRTYTDNTVADGTTYAYRVFALSGTESSSPSNTATVTTPIIAGPTNLNVRSVTANAITISWTDNSSNNTNFRIQRSPNGTTNWVNVGTTGANTTVYRNTGLARRTTYFYRVQAYSGGTVSSWSNTVSATTN
jgi:FtsP/CotA-like multicopper oxidase with cupredoxin domain